MTPLQEERALVYRHRATEAAKKLEIWPRFLYTTSSPDPGLYLITAEKTPEGKELSGFAKLGHSMSMRTRGEAYKKPEFQRWLPLHGAIGREDLLAFEGDWRYRALERGVPLPPKRSEFYPQDYLGELLLCLIEMGEDYRPLTRFEVAAREAEQDPHKTRSSSK